MNVVVPGAAKNLDGWGAPGAVLLLGLGTVVLLAGLGAGELRLAVCGGAVVVAGTVVLIAGGWLDGLALLAASLPLPALFSTESLRLAPAAAMTAVVLMAWSLDAAARPARRLDLGTLPRRSIVGLLAAVMLATLFAQHTAPAIRELVNFGLLLALLVVATIELRRAPGRVHKLARVIAAVTGAVGALAVLETLSVLPGRFPLTGTSLQRAAGGFGWPNELGVFIAIALPLTVHAYRTAASRGGRFWTAAALGFAILGLGATFSRGSWLALVAAAPILLVGGDRRLFPRILLVAAVAVLAGNAVFGGAVSDRITATLQDPYVVQRLALTLTGVLMFLAHPLVGIGPGGFDEGLTEFGPQVTWLWDYVGTAHNAYVDMAAETGAIGLIAFVAFLGTILITLLRSARRAADGPAARKEEGLRRALLWSFAVSCAAGFTVWPLAHGIGQLVMLVAAMGIALDRGEAVTP